MRRADITGGMTVPDVALDTAPQAVTVSRHEGY